jgi:hypothetical protein
VADVRIENDELTIKLSLVDKLLAFHGSMHVPLSHVTNAFVSSIEELELQFKLRGFGPGFLKTVGVFTNPQGVIFCDITGVEDCLVVETRGERFPTIAVTLPKDIDPNAFAHEIMQRLPDSGG